jgi:hypothetical protein
MLLCHFGPPHTFTQSDLREGPDVLRPSFVFAPAKSFVSPTSTKCACNPFVSPTYAKTGGRGESFASITSFPLATRHCFENSAPICRLSAVNCEPVFLRPAFTTTSIDIVGAPTVPFLHASARSQERSPSPTRSGRAPGGPFQPSTFNFQPFFSPNPNHSRTSKTFARKSNHSRTYAKTGGGGGACLLVRQVQLSARRHSRSCAREGVCHGGRSAEKKRDSSLRSE